MYIMMCLDCVKVMQKKQDLVKPSLSQSKQESVVNVTPTDATVEGASM